MRAGFDAPTVEATLGRLRVHQLVDDAEFARYWVEQAANMAQLLQTTDPEVAAGRDAYIVENNAGAPPPPPPLGPGLHAGPESNGGILSVQPLVDDVRLDDLVGAEDADDREPEEHHGTEQHADRAGPPALEHEQ